MSALVSPLQTFLRVRANRQTRLNGECGPSSLLPERPGPAFRRWGPPDDPRRPCVLGLPGVLGLLWHCPGPEETFRAAV